MKGVSRISIEEKIPVLERGEYFSYIGYVVLENPNEARNNPSRLQDILVPIIKKRLEDSVAGEVRIVKWRQDRLSIKTPFLAFIACQGNQCVKGMIYVDFLAPNVVALFIETQGFCNQRDAYGWINTLMQVFK